MLDIRSNQRTGIHRYGTSLTAALDRLPVDAHGLDLRVLADRHQLAALPAAGRRYTLAVAPRPDAFVRRSDWVMEYLRRHRPRLYFTTHYSVDRRINVPFVYTVHDLHRLRFPEHGYTRESVRTHYGPDEWGVIVRELRALRPWDNRPAARSLPVFLRYFRAMNLFLASRAQAVAAVSDATRADVVDLLGQPGPQVHVVPGGVDPRTFHPRPHRARAVRDRYDLRRYLLYVGLAGPTKRFTWMLRSLLDAGALDHTRGDRLVVVGGHAERRPEVRELLGRAGGRDVVFTGYLSDADLAGLYTGAAALVVPSLAEGYHLSTVEALASGCEVIAADIPALRETTGRYIHRHPVDSSEALAELCAAALDGRLPRRAPGFPVPSWSDAARRWLTVTTAVLDGAPG